MATTDNHAYNVPDLGKVKTDGEYWGTLWNNNASSFDKDIPIVDTDTETTNYAPFDNQLYVANDTRVVYIGNGASWIKEGLLGGPSVSDNGTTVLAPPDDINFGTHLHVTDDGDQTITVDVDTDYAVSTVTANYTADDDEVVLGDASGGAITVTLPPVEAGIVVNVKKVDSSTNGVTIATPNTETIDGQSSISITSQYASRTITSDGTNYFVI